jgi:DNA-binding GntR family transcriptional regulator
MAAPGPLYRNLARVLQRAVELGDLQPGQRLPSERELARTLVAYAPATAEILSVGFLARAV